MKLGELRKDGVTIAALTDDGWTSDNSELALFLNSMYHPSVVTDQHRQPGARAIAEASGALDAEPIYEPFKPLPPGAVS